MKMLIYIKENWLVQVSHLFDLRFIISFDVISIRKKYVRSVSDFEKFSKNSLLFVYFSLINYDFFL